MTVSTQTGPWFFTATPFGTLFPVPATVFDADSLGVAVLDPTTHLITVPIFSVTLADDFSGANVTIPSGLIPGQSVCVYRKPIMRQNADLGYQNRTVERQLDRGAEDVAALYSSLQRALRGPIGENLVLAELPAAALRAGKVLGFDGSGQPSMLSNVPVSPQITLGAIWQTALLTTTAAAARAALGVIGAVDSGSWTGTNDFSGGRIEVPTRGRGDKGLDAASTAFVNTAIGDAQGPRRQTVVTGPDDGTGKPGFLATTSGLALSTVDLSALAPLVITAASGATAADRVAVLTSDQSFGTLPDNNRSYLYFDVNADGTATGGNTTNAPSYVPGGGYATGSGAFTFNYNDYIGKLGNGLTAAQVWRVFVGEATTSGGNVTAVTPYAYNGRYDSGFTPTLPAGSTTVSKSHNIGVAPAVVRFIIENTTTDAGYSVGDQISQPGSLQTNDGVTVLPPPLKASALAASIRTASAGLSALNNAATAHVNLTAGNWKYKLIADRGW